MNPHNRFGRHQFGFTPHLGNPIMMGQFVHPYDESMHCSEILTLNRLNGQGLSSINQFSENISNLSIEKLPEKRLKNNHSQTTIISQASQFDQSHSNNRKSDQNHKETDKKLTMLLLQQFDSMQFKYSNEEFTFQINRFCKKIATEKNASEIACRFPLFKMIRSIIKKFLFNELEVIYFGYILEETKWKIDDIELRKHAYFMIDFLNITEVNDLLEYKSVLLFLILTAYGVKAYLNEESETKVFQSHLSTIIKDFSSLFQYWTSIYGQISPKVIPKSVNRVFRNLTNQPSLSNSNKKQHEDYNALVDAIIQISPPYNNERSLNEQSVDNSFHSHHQRQKASSLKIAISPQNFYPRSPLKRNSVIIPIDSNNFKTSSRNQQYYAQYHQQQNQQQQPSTRKLYFHKLIQHKQEESTRTFREIEQPFQYSDAYQEQDNIENYPVYGSIHYMQPSQQSQESTVKFDMISSSSQANSKQNSISQVNFTDQLAPGLHAAAQSEATQFPYQQNGDASQSNPKVETSSRLENCDQQFENMDYLLTTNNPLLQNNQYNFNTNYGGTLHFGAQQLAPSQPQFLQANHQIDNQSLDGQNTLQKAELIHNRISDSINGNPFEQQQTGFFDSTSQQMEDNEIDRESPQQNSGILGIPNNITINGFQDQNKCQNPDSTLFLPQQAEYGQMYQQFQTISSMNNSTGILFQPTQPPLISSNYNHLKI